MSRSTAVLILVVIVALALVCLALAGPALTETGSPSPSPSASPSPTATPTPPAPAALVHHALKVRRSAVKAWTTWNRARSCFGMPHRHFDSPKPRRSASAEVWLAAMREWRAKRADLLARTGRLLDRMRHPGGFSNGTRWLPLARWVGWPKHVLLQLSCLIMNESSGIQRNISATDDWGLSQLHRQSWAAEFRRVIGVAFEKGALVAEYNLRFALYIYHHLQHDSFLPAWAGDPAVGG